MDRGCYTGDMKTRGLKEMKHFVPTPTAPSDRARICTYVVNFRVLLLLKLLRENEQSRNGIRPFGVKQEQEKQLPSMATNRPRRSTPRNRLGKDLAASSFPEVLPDPEMGLSFWILVLNDSSKAPRAQFRTALPKASWRARGRSAILKKFHQGPTRSSENGRLSALRHKPIRPKPTSI